MHAMGPGGLYSAVGQQIGGIVIVTLLARRFKKQCNAA